MRIIGNLEEFVTIDDFHGEEVIVLGAGKDGKAVAQNLCSKGARVVGFIDDSKEKWGRQYYGIPVLPPAMVDVNGKVGVIAIGAFTWLSEEEILNTHLVQSSGFSSANLVLLDKSRFIAERIYQHLMERHIDSRKDVLKIGNLQLPNFLQMGQDIAKTFVVEAADLLLPHYFDDWSLVDEGPYEDAEIVSSREARSPVVLDCGANLGLFSAIAASKGAEVYAFEPIKKSRDVLCRLVDIYPSIKIFPFALSSFSGTVNMSNSGNLGQNKIVHENLGEGVSVICKTLDEFVHEEKLTHIDFLKADIEGAERDMLRGAKYVLREFAPKLSLCTYHLDDDPEVLEAIIKEANSDYQILQKEKKLFAYVEK